MSMSSYIWGAGLIIAVFAIAPLIVLPSSKTVTRNKLVEADRSEVFQLLSTTQGFQLFNPYKDTDPDLQIKPFGPSDGVGAGFSFEGKEGKGTQTIVAMSENKTVKMNIDLGALGKPVQTFTLSPQGSKTLVEWSVKSDFGLNPVFRVFGLFVDGMLGPIYERGLDNMNKVLKAKV